MEVGLSPRHVNRVLMVIRTFPIRVAGTSGPFANEISWEEICGISASPTVVPEFTSVTKRLRRVAKFDMASVKAACNYNHPTSLAVMGLDRLDYANTGITDASRLTDRAQRFLDDLETTTGVPIQFVGTGFSTFDAIALPIPAVDAAPSHV
jgi:adenylosuccinate synthase